MQTLFENVDELLDENWQSFSRNTIQRTMLRTIESLNSDIRSLADNKWQSTEKEVLKKRVKEKLIAETSFLCACDLYKSITG